jgi:DNA-binding MarR family transcriptional regulator
MGMREREERIAWTCGLEVKSLYLMNRARQSPSSQFPGDSNPDDPLIGARLRYLLTAVEARIEQALWDAGFDDLHRAHFKVLRFPPPENERPVDLASRAGMTKQAMNYMLAQLERLGYIDREPAAQGLSRRISLTGKGWQVARIQRETVHAIESEWSTTVGVNRFAAFYEVLSELADTHCRVASAPVPSKP